MQIKEKINQKRDGDWKSKRERDANTQTHEYTNKQTHMHTHVHTQHTHPLACTQTHMTDTHRPTTTQSLSLSLSNTYHSTTARKTHLNRLSESIRSTNSLFFSLSLTEQVQREHTVHRLHQLSRGDAAPGPAAGRTQLTHTHIQDSTGARKTHLNRLNESIRSTDCTSSAEVMLPPAQPPAAQ